MADHLRTTGQTLWDVDLLISMSGLFSRRIPPSVLVYSPRDRRPYRPKPSEVFPWLMLPLSCPHWVPGILLSYQHLPLLVNSPTPTSGWGGTCSLHRGPRGAHERAAHAVSSSHIPPGVSKAFKITAGHSRDHLVLTEPWRSLLCPALRLKAESQREMTSSSPGRPAASHVTSSHPQFGPESMSVRGKSKPGNASRPSVQKRRSWEDERCRPALCSWQGGVATDSCPALEEETGLLLRGSCRSVWWWPFSLLYTQPGHIHLCEDRKGTVHTVSSRIWENSSNAGVV